MKEFIQANFRITPEMRDEIRRIAYERDVSMTQVVREFLTECIQRNKRELQQKKGER